MNRSRSSRLLAWLAVSLALALAAAHPALAKVECQGAVYGADSPEALVEGVQAAARAGDMGELARYLSESDRAKAGFGLTVGATMMLAMQEMGLKMGEAAGGEEGSDETAGMKEQLAGLQARLEAILEKYGVEEPSEEAMGRMMQQGPDAESSLEEALKGVCTVGLIGELADFLSEVSERKVTDQLDRLKTDDVGPITVDTDTATAEIGGRPFQMLRIDGRWYVDIESTGR